MQLNINDFFFLILTQMILCDLSILVSMLIVRNADITELSWYFIVKWCIEVMPLLLRFLWNIAKNDFISIDNGSKPNQGMLKGKKSETKLKNMNKKRKGEVVLTGWY